MQYLYEHAKLPTDLIFLPTQRWGSNDKLTFIVIARD